MLPDADSGKFSIPQVSGIGFPFVTYYFKPATKLAEAKNKQSNLHAAIKTAWGNLLVEVKKPDTVNKLVYYKTYCYKNEESIKQAEVLFYSYLVYEKGSYQVVLTINGKTGSAPIITVPDELLYEANLDKKIKALLVSMDKQFADEKAVALSKNQYYTEYESRTTIYGQKCRLKDRGFEIQIYFYVGKPALAGPEEAKMVYEKLFTELSASGRFIFKPAIKENYRTYSTAFENNVDAWKSKLTLVIEYNDSPFYPYVSFLLTRKNN